MKAAVTATTIPATAKGVMSLGNDPNGVFVHAITSGPSALGPLVIAWTKTPFGSFPRLMTPFAVAGMVVAVTAAFIGTLAALRGWLLPKPRSDAPARDEGYRAP